MATDTGKVLSVNVGGVREFEYRGHPAESAIWKSPVSGRIAARGVNLEGDRQADRESHGGFDKAVYAYAVEDQRWWEREIGRLLSYGEFGENLTIRDVVRIYTRDRHEVARLLEISQLSESWRGWAEHLVQRGGG